MFLEKSFVAQHEEVGLKAISELSMTNGSRWSQMYGKTCH